jgi:hypothetical protein
MKIAVGFDLDLRARFVELNCEIKAPDHLQPFESLLIPALFDGRSFAGVVCRQRHHLVEC